MNSYLYYTVIIFSVCIITNNARIDRDTAKYNPVHDKLDLEKIVLASSNVVPNDSLHRSESTYYDKYNRQSTETTNVIHNYNSNVYDIELALLSYGINQIIVDSKSDFSVRPKSSPSVHDNQNDYSATYVKTKDGTVKIYRPKLFSNIRNNLHIPTEVFMRNLQPQNLICIQNTDSKSGQRFWISSDGLFVLKTLKHYECKNLKGILDHYYHHITTNEKSCIASVLGIYRVKRRGHLFAKYYLISRNVFPLLGSKDTFILKKYDLKGSTFGRLAALRSSVEKDINLINSGQIFNLGMEIKSHFLRTLENDVNFLSQKKFMDYSLLVSIERSPTKNFKRFPLNKKHPKFGSSLHEDSGKLVVLGADGNTYHFGIIDFLQKYTFRKRIEYLIKSLLFGSNAISCVPPNFYAQRMLTFLTSYII